MGDSSSSPYGRLMMMTRKSTAVVLLALACALAACGGGSGSDGSGPSAPSEAAVEKGGAGGDASAGVGSTLDIAAKSVVTVQSQKYDDYEIDGDVVRLSVRDGVELAGSECLIIDSATGADHPDAKWVLVEADGTETAC